MFIEAQECQGLVTFVLHGDKGDSVGATGEIATILASALPVQQQESTDVWNGSAVTVVSTNAVCADIHPVATSRDPGTAIVLVSDEERQAADTAVAAVTKIN